MKIARRVACGPNLIKTANESFLAHSDGCLGVFIIYTWVNKAGVLCKVDSCLLKHLKPSTYAAASEIVYSTYHFALVNAVLALFLLRLCRKMKNE